MKPGENLNNLSQVPRGAPLDSTTENNSFSSDSDMEVLSSGTADQKRIIQGLKRTIKRNQTKINDLTAKLTVAEILLASEKEKTKDKDALNKSLQISIDLNTEIKDLKITTLQTQLIELQTALDLSKSRNVTNDNSGQSLQEIESGQYNTKIDELNADIEILESKLKNRNDKLAELDDKTNKYESDLKEKDEHIAKLESQTKLSLETTQKYESDLKEKDEHIAKLESQTKLSLQTTQKYKSNLIMKDMKIAKLESQTKLSLQTTQKYISNLRMKDEKIAKLESQTKLSLEKTQKYESNLREKDEKIAKQDQIYAAEIKEMEDKLSKFTLKAETSQDSNDSLVLLNCTKIPSIKFVTLPESGRFAAVFEYLLSAGPGWMVIQRRVDGSVPFHTRETEYEFYDGFGDLSKEFWLGCDKLHELTTSRRHELYIELVDFDNATTFARYDNFVVDSFRNGYTLQSLGEYSGNAGDSLREQEKCMFEIVEYKDDDNIAHRRYSHGWWGYTKCNLNGRYYDQKTVLPIRYGRYEGIYWGRWNMDCPQALKACKMLIRPKP